MEKSQISPDLTKAAKDILDGSAEKNRNLFIAVNLLLATLLVLVLSITDFDLLILSKPLSLPLLNLGLPLVVFSITACVLVLALHFVLLYNLVEHRSKIDQWLQACSCANKPTSTTELFPSLFDFAYLRWHGHNQDKAPRADRGRELVYFSWLMYAVLPFTTVAAVFICFADLQQIPLSVFHLLCLSLDAWLVWAYWISHRYWQTQAKTKEEQRNNRILHSLIGITVLSPVAYSLWMSAIFAVVQVAMHSKGPSWTHTLATALVKAEAHISGVKLLPRLEVPRKRVTQLNEDFFKLYKTVGQAAADSNKQSPVPQSQNDYEQQLKNITVSPEPDLSNRNFAFADFQRSEFQGLNLSGSNFYGANLNQAKIQSALILDGMKYPNWRKVSGDFIGLDGKSATLKNIFPTEVAAEEVAERPTQVALAEPINSPTPAPLSTPTAAPVPIPPATSPPTPAQPNKPEPTSNAAPPVKPDKNDTISKPKEAAKQAAQEIEKRAAQSSQSDLISGRYKVLSGGAEVLDTQTKLIWQRCSVGQTWNGRGCEGEVKGFTFDNAQKQAGNGWRVPTIRELNSLVWCSNGAARIAQVDVGDGKGKLGRWCAGEVKKDFQTSTIDLAAFPNTPAAFYWSSSPYVGDTGYAWYVNFDYGYVGSSYRNGFNAVRLVRASQ